jgi:transcriptional regulator with XRE-family HTH domain
MDLKEIMATNLRRVRHGQKLTQEELAERSGLSSRYIGSIERAAVSATVTVLGQIADALNISPCELICPQGSDFSYEEEDAGRPLSQSSDDSC